MDTVELRHDELDETINAVAAAKVRWEQGTLRRTLERGPERKARFATTSGIPVERLYAPVDLENVDYVRDLSFPGEYPYTRGVYPTMYRGRPWTMRMFAGFGTAEETNARFKYLLEHGETGLSVAFDMPTLYGYDTDHSLAQGEFGKCGVGISSLADMELLFYGIPLGEVTTSMTINGPAAIIWAMYLVTAEKQGLRMDELGGTIQNDILKEYIAQKEFIFPPGPSMRLVVDTIEFGARHLPRWNPISISGYHIREAGANAVQELAFTLYDGIAYVQACLDRGLAVDDFAPRLSFFFGSHSDFFEEVAKFRAARRIWARVMRERFGAQDPMSWRLRFHSQTSGFTLTAQQPEVNVIRTALQALAAVIGGTQSLHTNSMDEALALPSEMAARTALRTQQVIAHESGVADTIDPFGGSYYVESLTNRVEEQVLDYFARLDAMGGALVAIEKGFFQRDIAETAYRHQHEIERQDRIVVGVNRFQMDEPLAIPLLEMDKEGARRHIERLNRVRRERDNAACERALAKLRQAAQGTENMMPHIVEAVRAYCTLGEMTQVLRDVFGEYRETPVL